MKIINKTDVGGLQLLSRFALPPNSLGLCGRNVAAQRFRGCITHGQCAGVGREFTHFMVLYPYLATLSKALGFPKFSLEVATAYWLGSDLLNQVTPKHYDLLLNNLLMQGASRELIGELRKHKPARFIPTHLFQILHIAVRGTGGTPEQILASINNCMIRWGEVLKIEKGRTVVNLVVLRKTGTAYSLAKTVETPASDKEITPGIRKGTIVAVHWNQIMKILTPEEARGIEYWTNEVISSIKAA